MMAFDKKAYMREWTKRPENAAHRRIVRKMYTSRPEIKADLARRKREDNATPDGKKKQKNRSLRRNYGLTIEEYNDRLKSQEHRCAICGINASALSVALHVDHCHETGIVRGLLCGRCNLGLGQFEDSQSRLELAIKYLEKHHG